MLLMQLVQLAGVVDDGSCVVVVGGFVRTSRTVCLFICLFSQCKCV